MELSQSETKDSVILEVDTHVSLHEMKQYLCEDLEIASECAGRDDWRRVGDYIRNSQHWLELIIQRVTSEGGY